MQDLDRAKHRDGSRHGAELERTEEQGPEPMQHRPSARGKCRQIGLVRTCEALGLVDAARQLVPADGGGDGFLQIIAAILGLDQGRTKLGQQAHLVVDRAGIAQQGVLLPDLRAAEHVTYGTVEQGDAIVGQARDGVEHGRDQGGTAAQG